VVLARSNKRIYKPNTIVARYYSVLFTLPSTKLLVVLSLMLLLALAVFPSTSSIPYMVYFATILLIIYLYSKTTSSVFCKPKRLLALAFITTLFSLAIGTITTWQIGLAASTSILVVAVLGLDGTKPYRYLVASSPPLLSFFTLFLAGFKVSIAGALLSILLISLLDYAVFLAISRYRVNGYSSADLGTYFMLNWLEKRRDLELVFEGIGETVEIKPLVLKNNKIALIYTDLHYGPFSNLGSSMLPKHLSVICRKQGIAPIILHGMGSHDRDLVSARYVDEFIEKFSKILGESGDPVNYYGSFELVGEDNWRILGLVFTNLSILLISRPGKGIDDLPYYLQVEVSRKAFERGLGEVILVDLHNWEKMEEYDLDALGLLLDKALGEIERLRTRTPVKPLIKVAVGKVNAPGVIEGEVCTTLIVGEDGRAPVILVYLRGNNIAPGVRNDLIDAARSAYNGKALIEVLTNDEHTETGIKPRITYVPIQRSKELIETVKGLVEEFREARGVTGLALSSTYMEVDVLGKSTYRLLHILRKAFPLSATLIPLYIFVLSPITAYTVFSLGF